MRNLLKSRIFKIKFKEFIRDYYSILIIIIVIIISVIIRFAGNLTDQETISMCLVSIAGLAVCFLLIDSRREKDYAPINNLLDKIQSVNLMTRREHYLSLIKHINNAEKRIWITTIEPKLHKKVVNTLKERVKYYSSLEKVINDNPDVIVRRIYGLPVEESSRKDKIEWIKKDLSKLKDNNNFQAKIFDWKEHSSTFPPLSIQIIDDDFIGIVNLLDGTAVVEGGGKDFCTTEPNAIKYFERYYEDIWDHCKELKTGAKIFKRNLI